jgi:hypothetical protein
VAATVGGIAVVVGAAAVLAAFPAFWRFRVDPVQRER